MKCVYYLCRNTTTITPKNKEISFFSFPINTDRCRQWCINSNRLDLTHADTGALQNLRICSEHFSPDDFFQDADGGYMVLNKDAVPYLYCERAESKPDFSKSEESTLAAARSESPPITWAPQDNVCTRNTRKRPAQQRTLLPTAVAAGPTSCEPGQINSYEPVQINSDVTATDAAEDYNAEYRTPAIKMRVLEVRCETAEKAAASAQEKYLNALKKIVKLQEQVKESSKKFQDLKMTLDEWREGALPEEILMKSIVPYLPPALQCLLHMQMRKGQGYNNEDRRFAIELHKVSPVAYEFLQKQAVNLPMRKELKRMEQRLNASKQDGQEAEDAQDAAEEEGEAGND